MTEHFKFPSQHAGSRLGARSEPDRDAGWKLGVHIFQKEVYTSFCGGQNTKIFNTKYRQKMAFQLEQVQLTKWKSPLLWSVLYFLIYLLAYALLITRPGLHIDEVIDFSGKNTDIYLAAGRWGTYLYRKAVGVGMFPITSGLFAGIYLAITLIVQTKLFNFETNISKLLYGLIYIGCNQWASQLIYSFQCDAVALALLFCTIGIYILTQKSSVLLPAVLFTLALSVYQCCAIYFLVVWCCTVFSRQQITFRNVIRFALISITSIILYFLISHIFKSLPLISESNRIFVTQYQASISQWDDFLKLDAATKILFILHYGKKTLFEASGISGDNINYVQLTVPILAIYLAARVCIRNSKANKFMYPMALIAIWVLPFSMHLILPGSTPERTLLAQPVSLAFFWAMAFCAFKQTDKLVLALLSCAGCLLLKAAYKNASTARNDAHTYNMVVRELSNMHLAGNLLAQRNGIKSAKVILLHDPDKQAEKHRHVHMNFIRGILERNDLHWYTSHLLLSNLIQSDNQLYEKHKSAYHEMSCWPEADSIRLHQGDIIIRITPHQPTSTVTPAR